MIPVALLLLLLFGVGSAEQCPSYPNPRTVSPEQLFQSPEVVEALAAIDALFTNESASLPGFFVTVVFDQQTMFAKGYGYKNITNKKQGPPTRTSLVRIASITKTFTTTLMYVLQERSLLSLEDNVKQYLPTFSMQLAKNITLRELASHTAGIPREMPYPCASFTVQGTSRLGRASSSCNETAILEILQTKAIMSPTHRRFHYSNLGMALLGRALAHVPGNAVAAVAGRSTYEDLVRHYITAPLQMNNATFIYNATTKSRSAVGVSLDGKVVDMPFSKSCGFGAPAGCLWASAQDMELWMKFLFRIDPLPSQSKSSKSSRSSRSSKSSGHHDPLSSGTIAEMLAPSVLLRNGYEAVGSPFEMQYIANKYWTKGKQGELPGYRSSLTLIEELKLGIFTSALQTDTKSNSVWTIPALTILAPAVDKALTRLQPPVKLPQNYEMYVGKYFDGSMSIRTSGNRLIFAMGSLGAEDELDLIAHPLNYHLRAQNKQAIGCRWLDDGTNNEIVEFIVVKEQVVALEFMGSRYDRLK